jgi:hypothetical protein
MPFNKVYSANNVEIDLFNSKQENKNNPRLKKISSEPRKYSVDFDSNKSNDYSLKLNDLKLGLLTKGISNNNESDTSLFSLNSKSNKPKEFKNNLITSLKSKQK